MQTKTPYTISFRFKYPTVSPQLGCYHIHAPEHIAQTHRLGAPRFVIDSVKPPRITPLRRSIEFDCRTMNIPMHVFMHRRSAYESELVFTRRSVDPTSFTTPLFNYVFSKPPDVFYDPDWTMYQPLAPSFLTPKNRSGVFLKLLFEVFPLEATNQGHELGVTFSFWNPWILLLVPLFPVFVAINGLEDLFYFKSLEAHGIPEDQGTWFDLYRRE